MDISKFLDRFNENYNFLYDNSDRVAGYYEGGSNNAELVGILVYKNISATTNSYYIL